MLLLSMLLAKDIAEKAYAQGEPYTVWKCIKDVLVVCLLMVIEFFVFIGAHIILHTSNIQQNDVWAKPSVYGAAFIVMCLVCVGCLKLVNRVELIIKEKRKP